MFVNVLTLNGFEISDTYKPVALPRKNFRLTNQSRLTAFAVKSGAKVQNFVKLSKYPAL